MTTRVARTVLIAAALAASTAAGPPAGQRAFDSPEAATKALIAAARADDDQALLEIFGAKHADLFDPADAARRDNHARFVKAADEYLLLRSEDGGAVTIVVGYEAWPFPIPLVKDGSTWRFDTDAGREEVLNRRIGANEIAAIDAMRAYVDAQRQYAAKPRNGEGVREFARKLRSTPGKKDGLYWDADPEKGEEPSPVGPLLGDATARSAGDPYHGYYFRILTRQGAAAPAGAYDYVINGRMLAGFAAIAFPAEYGRTGIKTFIVNHYRIVYEKDLGRSTPTIAATMAAYDPDRSWRAVEDE